MHISVSLYYLCLKILSGSFWMLGVCAHVRTCFFFFFCIAEPREKNIFKMFQVFLEIRISAPCS